MIFDIINKDPGFIISDSLDNIEKPGTYSFLPGDTENQFNRNLKVKPNDWYYRTNDVKYTINSDKFRTKEFKDINWENSIVLVGCSFTFGMGVTDEHTIAAYLQKITGKDVVNLGQIASSNAIISYNSYYLKQNYPTPLAVVNIWTTMARWFWIDYKEKKKHLKLELMSYAPSDDDGQSDRSDSLHHPNPSASENKVITEVTNNIMHMKMSNCLWKDHSNHLQLSVHDYFKGGKYISIAAKVFPEVIQLKHSWVNNLDARDNVHWGRETSEKIAKLIASNLKL